jgi:hypothetical protein
VPIFHPFFPVKNVSGTLGFGIEEVENQRVEFEVLKRLQELVVELSSPLEKRE